MKTPPKIHQIVGIIEERRKRPEAFHPSRSRNIATTAPIAIRSAIFSYSRVIVAVFGVASVIAVVMSLQLLEINLVSAQDLEPVSKSMQTYAVAWLHPERKLLSRVDRDGHTNPTWNEKFLFRVDEKFLNADTSAIMVEIYASSWLRDTLIGSVRVLISNLLAPTSLNEGKSRMRVVALQVRRPSGRPQGILNVGVTLLDSNMRSMSIYSELSASAVGYWDLMDVKTQKPSDPQSPTSDKFERKTSRLRHQRSLSEGSDPMGDGYGMKMSSIYDSELVAPEKGGNALSSDVGQVVTGSMGKKLHLTTLNNDLESSLLDDWTEDSSVEGLKTKIARWHMALPSIFDSEYQKIESTRKRSGHRRSRSAAGRLFSCFGNGYGFEFSITCGGGTRKRRMDNGRVHLITASESTFDSSYM